MRRTIAWITPIIFLVFVFNSCGGGGGFNTQRPDAIKEVKATCINDYHSLADANKGFSLCIEKVNEEECQKLTEPDADFMVKSYLINPACLEAGFPADSLTEGTNVKIYTLRRPLNADEAVIIGGQNTSATSVAMYGDKKIHIDTPNGVTVDMKRHNTNDKITKITVHNPNETTSLLSLDETHVVTLLDLKFDSFKPDDFGLTAFDFSPTLTIPNDLVSGYDTRTLSVFRISDRMIDGEIVTAYASNLPITITENGDLTVKDFYFSDSIASSLQYAKTSRSTVSGPNHIRYVLGTFSDSINWKRTPRLYHMHIDPEASAGRSGDPYGSVGNIQNISNIILFVHGHNETEKTGIMIPPDQGVREPWYYQYKRDVWTPFYKYMAQYQKNILSCTDFYEFIYPTYRPIFTEEAGINRLDKDFATAVNNLVETVTDSGTKDINLYIVAHSMGGLVARAGIQLFNATTDKSFKRLVTWGSPHRGAALVSLRYVLGAPEGLYKFIWHDTINEGILGLAHIAVDHLQIDSPGARDLRWAKSHMSPPKELALNNLFSYEGAVELWDRYDIEHGSEIYNRNLNILNRNDKYRLSQKYHALYGITTKIPQIVEWDKSFGISVPKYRPANFNEIGVGALVTSWLVANANEIYRRHTLGSSDGAVPIVSISGDGIMGAYTDVGDVNHEEYFNDPAASMDMVAKTLNIFNIEECADISYEPKKWENWPNPQYCPLIADNNRFYNDLPAYTPGVDNIFNSDFIFYAGDTSGYGFFIDTNHNSDDHTRVQCVYRYSYGKEHYVLWLERPWLDLSDIQYLRNDNLSTIFQARESQDKVRHGWWKEYRLVYDYSYLDTNYTPRLMLRWPSVEYYNGNNIDEKDGSDNVKTFEPFQDPGYTPQNW